MKNIVLSGASKILLAALLVCVAASCTEKPTYQGQVGQTSVGSIRLLSGEKLPEAARDVWLYAIDQPQKIQLVRFDLDSSTAKRFSFELVKAELRSDFDPGVHLIGPKLSWWPSSFPAGAVGWETQLKDTTVRVAVLYHGNHARIWIASYEHL
jgi:hypothetical protein